MSHPIADFEVFLEAGARARVMQALARPAKWQGVSPEEMLDLIAITMKAARNYGKTGPGHRMPPEDSIPPPYLAYYDSLHIERYFGVQVSYGIVDHLSRLVIINAVFGLPSPARRR